MAIPAYISQRAGTMDLYSTLKSDLISISSLIILNFLLCIRFAIELQVFQTAICNSLFTKSS